MNSKIKITLCICTLFLTACVKPFQPDIQQGNIINNNDLKEIRYGMSKQEVLFLLGTPMVIDPFNESRWDYFYSKLNQRKRETDKRLITAMFDGDKLVSLQGDVDLSNIESLEPSIEDRQHGGTVITTPQQKEKGLLNRVLKRKPKLERRNDRIEKKRAREAEKAIKDAAKEAEKRAKAAAKKAKDSS